MYPTIKIDKTDQKILKILQENAKITNAQLAKEIDLSPAPTLERVKKLEAAGIIKSYHARLNERAVGIGLVTFLMVKLQRHNKADNEEFVSKINQIDEIIECHHVIGAGNYILKIVSHDTDHFRGLILKKLCDIDAIAEMESFVVLATEKDSRTLPIF